MKTVELYARVRHAVLIEGIRERAAADRFGINARTVSNMLKFSVPPGYVRTKPPFRPKLDEFTGALLDRLTHHVHILEMNGDSFRLAHSKRRSRRARSEPPSDAAPQE
jgi:DNA-binding transcriptional regulator LsrR (DeoR family)